GGPRSRGAALLPRHPAACDAVADLLGCAGEWSGPEASPEGAGGPSGVALLAAHPAACDAVAALLGCEGAWDTGRGADVPGALLTARHPRAGEAWEAVLTRS
ncbi:hypothetical protein, partial [Streptomyces sp. SID5606]